LYFVSDYLFKLLLIGDSGVGKSCLLLRFAVSFEGFVVARLLVFTLLGISNLWLAVFYSCNENFGMLLSL